MVATTFESSEHAATVRIDWCASKSERSFERKTTLGIFIKTL
jgi:hypothetical protein